MTSTIETVPEGAEASTEGEALLAKIDRDDLRATLDTLSPIERGACSPGEREAAEWIARRLEPVAQDVGIEEEQAFRSYAPAMAALSALTYGSGLLALGGRRDRRHRVRRLLGFKGAAVAAAAIADDISNGPRAFRSRVQRTYPTWNVVATAGDAAAERTIVVLAHHDAAPTGFVFDQTLHQSLGARFPEAIERTDTAIPLWWPVFGAPLLVALGALTGRRGLTRTGAVLGAAGIAAFGDIARGRIVPGASDNLSGVACQIALAERFAAEPVEGIRVLLVSCGAEEIMQGGIRGFAARHFPSLPVEGTWFLNLETLGGPRLNLLEGEGPLKMEDYPHPEFRDLLASSAARLGIHVRRNMRARATTDSVIPARAGYPTLMLVSTDYLKALKEYHLMSDTPENVEIETLARAVAVSETLIRSLAAA